MANESAQPHNDYRTKHDAANTMRDLRNRERRLHLFINENPTPDDMCEFERFYNDAAAWSKPEEMRCYVEEAKAEAQASPTGRVGISISHRDLEQAIAAHLECAGPRTALELCEIFWPEIRPADIAMVLDRSPKFIDIGERGPNEPSSGRVFTVEVPAQQQIADEQPGEQPDEQQEEIIESSGSVLDTPRDEPSPAEPPRPPPPRPLKRQLAQLDLFNITTTPTRPSKRCALDSED